MAMQPPMYAMAGPAVYNSVGTNMVQVPAPAPMPIPQFPMPQIGQPLPVRLPDSIVTTPTKGTKIGSGVYSLFRIPKWVQVDGIQKMSEALDSTLTGGLSAEELAIVVWLLCRIAPNFKMCDLRCSSYEETVDHQME